MYNAGKAVSKFILGALRVFQILQILRRNFWNYRTIRNRAQPNLETAICMLYVCLERLVMTNSRSKESLMLVLS
jgi:hypothetical protein